MTTADGNPTAEELERHARWIKRLAHALLRDEGAAEDLVQETWLAALRQPPAAGKLRPWLRRVAHNFARQHHRGRSRRAQRELAARPPAEPEAPDAFAQRLETEQRLTRELAALDGTFRTVLMLRYYEGLEPGEIAARLGLPGGTVRWRLMRGLALLRERLDRAHGGDRSAWSLAFLPLARPEAAAGLAATATGVVLPGVVLMNALKLSAAGLAVLGLAFGLSLSGVLPESLSLAHRERTLEVGFRPLELAAVDEPQVDSALTPASEAGRVASAVESEPAAEEAAAHFEATTIDARLSTGGRALRSGRLVVVHDDDRHEAPVAGESRLATCSFWMSEPSARVRVELSSLGYASVERWAICERGAQTHLGQIELVPGGAVSGRVVDEHGVGLAGCRVTLGSLELSYAQLEAARLEPAPDRIPSCTSDADGRFLLLGVAAGMHRLWAHGEGRRAGYTPPLEVRAGQESTGVDVVLAPLAPENRLHGIVLDPTGEPVPRARIEYRHAIDGGDSVTSSSTSADREGRFEFLLPADARTWLRASDPDGRWSLGSLADLPNGARPVVLELREAREVELLVRSRSQGPLERFAVELRGLDGAPSLEDMAEVYGSEHAAEKVAEHAPRIGGPAAGERPGGRARFALPDQPFLLRVLAPAHRLLQLGPLDPAHVAASLECTLEPTPGLAGVVLRADAPAPGVRVELRAEVGEGAAVRINGYPQRLEPEAHDETWTDPEGRFVLTPRAAGRYVVRAMPAAGAPAEIGPLTLDPALAGPPLELVLGVGGAIEGRVTLRDRADPEGAIVGITRGDGGERTVRVGRDGRFRFEALLPGPWRVELREEEVFERSQSVETNRSPDVEPFQLAANCVVREGETTHVDVSETPPGSLLIEGRLTLDGRPAAGWTARLGLIGRLDFDGNAETALDSDGRFELRVEAPGDYRIMLRKHGGEHEEQYLFDDITLGGTDATWEHALHTGKLLLAGLDVWDGEGPPRAVHYWKGPGRLFGLAVPVGGEGAHGIDVPAGPAELRVPGRSQDPAAWRVLRAVDVPRGGELRVELRPEDLDED
jgi:RNA polymerase sigma-70 factor (ECF subfamily)